MIRPKQWELKSFNSQMGCILYTTPGQIVLPLVLQMLRYQQHTHVCEYDCVTITHTCEDYCVTQGSLVQEQLHSDRGYIPDEKGTKETINFVF